MTMITNSIMNNAGLATQRHLPTLKIGSINVNSLVSDNKQLICQTFLDTHDFDILLVSETKLNPRRQCTFAGYTIHREDRPENHQGGGTAVIYKEGLNIAPVAISYNAADKLTEVAVVKIKFSNNTNLFIVSCYIKPNANVHSKVLKEMDDLFGVLNLHSINNYYIVAGDLNARHLDWGDSLCNRRGRQLKKWLEMRSIMHTCFILRLLLTRILFWTIVL